MHEIEQRARHGAGRLGEIDQPVDGLGELGRAARAVAHLAFDETWIDGAAAHDPGQRRIEGACARAARIGRVEHHQIGVASERGGSRGEAADMRHVLGAFEQVARRIVAAMQQQIGRGNARGEATGQRRALSLRAAITMRRGREIGGTERLAVAVLAEQLLDARAISAGRGAEDARERRAIVACETCRGSQRIFVVAPRRVARPAALPRRSARSAPGTGRGTGPKCARSHRRAGDPSRPEAEPRCRSPARCRCPRSDGSPSARDLGRSPRRPSSAWRCPKDR